MRLITHVYDRVMSIQDLTTAIATAMMAATYAISAAIMVIVEPRTTPIVTLTSLWLIATICIMYLPASGGITTLDNTSPKDVAAGEKIYNEYMRIRK